ncbi:MAG TPA: phosphoribosylformylglycinamidine cyclo-ligase [Candidatus Cloacimonadota bacterium]|nr:phosphoribosylformylglycinamidine cyclo-ligase [Candidatus Cloacimonadota bacterium]
MDYKSSGVDVAAGEQAVLNIKSMVSKTYNRNVLSDLGSFGGLYRLDLSKWQHPVLVSSTDGVGTKLRVAIMAERFDSVGQCLVNHCVNDILVQGAHPQFFLDYIGLAGMDGRMVEEIIKGMVQACQENSCALIGGEMAEMPGIYQPGDFDLAGTIVGLVEEEQVLPRNLSAGDVLMAFPSTGLHTNGYSLARRIVFDRMKYTVHSYITELGASLIDLLLAVHRSYYHDLLPYLTDSGLHGLAHITGGGIKGNLKRIIPADLAAEVSFMKIRILPFFAWLAKIGGLEMEASFEAFNLGVGMIAVVTEELASKLEVSTEAYRIGNLIRRSGDLDAVQVVL